MNATPVVDVVVPTIGRPSLHGLLATLAAEGAPGRILLVDDRPDATTLLGGAGGLTGPSVAVLRGPAAGPAAARNVGWRAATAPWVVFLDDDVLPSPGWSRMLLDDLAGLPDDVAASQGCVRVPLPHSRAPRDWERNTAGLEDARWATADIAYRRRVLEEVGGFDERFPAAYREDADLGLRVTAAGHRIVDGRRHVLHPIRPAGPWVSVRLQRGNADDALMRRLHGPDWREAAGVPAGRRPRHLAIAAAGLAAIFAVATGHRSAAVVAGAVSLIGITELTWARVAPGPRDPKEIGTMLATSAVLPWAATLHWARGLLRARRIDLHPSVPLRERLLPLRT